MQVVEAINTEAGRLAAAYTFDAGPNAVVYYVEQDAELVEGALRKAVGEKEGWRQANVATGSEPGEGLGIHLQTLRNGVSRVIQTSVGDGPIGVQQHLVDEDGNAVNI